MYNVQNVIEEQAMLNAKRCIVMQALQIGLHGKLLTNVQFSEKYGIVAGTMQRALKILKDAQALTTISKGHMGRVITQIDTGLCWNIAKLKPVQLLMPCRGSIEIDVLIDLVITRLSQLNIPYFIVHQPGGEKRVSQVLNGDFDITLVSLGAVKNSKIDIGDNQLKVLDAGSYYALNRLIVVSRDGYKISSPLRVAIDSTSPDHAQLTKIEFPAESGVEYVESKYGQVPALVINKDVDVGLWHMTYSPIPLEHAGLQATILSRPESVAAHKDLSAAAFVINPHRIELASLLDEINDDDISQNQKQAMMEEDPCNRAFDITKARVL